MKPKRGFRKWVRRSQMGTPSGYEEIKKIVEESNFTYDKSLRAPFLISNLSDLVKEIEDFNYDIGFLSKDARVSLFKAFSWGYTPQGSGYWLHVYEGEKKITREGIAYIIWMYETYA